MTRKTTFWVLVWFILVLSNAKADTNSQINLAVYIEPPYVDLIDGDYVGINIDVINLIAKELNKTVRYTQCPFVRCMLLMRDGSVDVIIGIKKTAERSQYVTYLDQPYNTQNYPLKFYLLKNTQLDIKQYSDLQNLRIGTIRGALYFAPFDQDLSLNKTTVTTYEQLIQLLLKGRIDTFIEREESVTPWINSEVYQNNIKSAQFQYDNAVGSYIALSKKSALLDELIAINKIQEQLILSEKIQAIYLNWTKQ